MPNMRLHKPDDLRILAFGDSLTEGYTDFGTTFHPYGPALYSTLKKLMPNFAGIRVHVEGQSGDCVLPSLGGDFSERLQAATAKESSYDLIIILGGTNDLAYKFGADLEGAQQIFEEGLKVLYEFVLAKTEANLLVMTVPERAMDTRNSGMGRRAKANREYLNSLIKDWVQQQSERVFMMDLAPMVPFPRDKGEDYEEPFNESIWSPDGLHMSAAGYDFVGHELASFIHGLL